ncbi:helix-turn-helix domain-containing protein [Streptomyces sp. GQFP]|uniref:helix-turn-helix domain-containing protein n=1 Tax=Streptomyces sp. GQFP TaxID=2907545 RepID=UPI001F32F4DA|nr:helix-turn-helix transcriptional regulator [Streptomyces sp. GQFP]UIX33055.1 helix-turn-helix domain-containing protein [Streptomyces sp. GQFP]
MAGPKDLDPASSPRAFLGAELRHAREAAGLSQEQLGSPLFVSGSFIGQLEAGTRRMMHEYAVQFDKMLDTKDFFERNCAALAKSKYPENFTEAAEAEAIATTIRHYLPLLIPGLLQTPEYAAALFRTYRPLAPESEIEELVALRMERTHVLDDPTTPLFWGILDEAALRRAVGGAATMAKALRHVADMARRHRIIVQVLPFSAGAHAGMGGSLKLMEFADAPPLCFIEGMDTGKLMDDPAKIARHSLTFSLLQAAALSPQDSLALIEAVAQDYENEEQP